MYLYGFSEEELRTLCKKKVESLEYWLRRIIHEKFSSQYGDGYFTKQLDNGENIIKREISKKSQARREEQPDRYPREIDATLLDDVISIICNKKNYDGLFKDSFYKVAPLGNEHLRHVLSKIWECRNPLSHANPISVRQAEQLLCYSDDIIDSLKEYYLKQGLNEMYNVPTILRMTDSLGNTIYRDTMVEAGDDSVIVSLHKDSKHFLRPSDIYSVEVDIDPSFDSSLYEIFWFVNHNKVEEKKNKFVITLENKHVSSVFHIMCKLKTNNDWHKSSDGYDDSLSIMLKVLPPL